ncbi:hypothetical protein TWF281_009635 [Arthrobotrys megalospora]
MKLGPLLLLSLPGVLSRPQAYSDNAFAVSTNAGADSSHITAATIPSIDQDGTWETLTTSHDHVETGGAGPAPTAPISDHPSAHSMPGPASVPTSGPGGAVETLSQQTIQPISPSHIDSHGLNELLAGVSNSLSALGGTDSSSGSSSSSGSGAGTGGTSSDSTNESRDIAQDINEIVEGTENEFLAASQQSVEPGFVPVYFAGGYFVAELTIGSSYLLIKVDTSSFHFWVVSNLLPDMCREATKSGSGCYKPDASATSIPGDVGYTFRYKDGTQASGKQIYSDNVSAAGIFGAAAWTKQVLALPSQLQHWDASGGISGILPLGFNAKSYWSSKASSTTSTTGSSSNSTEEILDESPLDITNWHFFTTYFKPGSQMFIGFDYEPKDLYEGTLTEIPVAPINGSWFVMPDSTWATVGLASASGSATAAATDARTTPEATPMDSATESEAATTESPDTESVDTESSTPTDGGDSGSTTPTDAAAATTDESSPTETMGPTDTTSPTDTGASESFSIDLPVNTQLVATAGTDSIKRSIRSRLAKRQDSASLQYPILLDTGSKETFIDSATVKSIYNSLQGSCLTVGGNLQNCTFPCSFNYSNFAITPEYPASIGLPWGLTTIPVDLTQFSSEIYDGCHPASGSDACSSTCRGLIQAQKPGKEYYVYGALVFKSAFFKWDTSGNGTIGMAPYAGRGGGSWYYQ